MPVPTRFTQVQIGDMANTPAGRLEALGYSPVSQSKLISYTGAGSAVPICTIPANSQILDIYVDVYTAFNSSGTDLLDIGIAGSAAKYADDLNVGSTGRLLASSQAAKLIEFADIGTSQVTINATYAQSVADASAGSARVTVVYIPGNNLL